MLPAGGALEDARRLRMTDFYERQDLFFPFSTWPPMYQRMALSNHLSNRDEYLIFNFWISNGLSPDIARVWLQLRDIAQNGGYVYTNDNSCFRHANQMLQYHSQGKWIYAPTKDMITGRFPN